MYETETHVDQLEACPSASRRPLLVVAGPTERIAVGVSRDGLLSHSSGLDNSPVSFRAGMSVWPRARRDVRRAPLARNPHQ